LYAVADIKRVLFTADEVKGKVAELGQQICRDYKGKKLAIIGVLNGAFIFTAGEYLADVLVC
jgi:hypoxanthine phosphoribosyltransferase